jgi:hypothetical protein
MNVFTLKNGIYGLILLAVAVVFLKYQPSILSSPPVENSIFNQENPTDSRVTLDQSKQNTATSAIDNKSITGDSSISIPNPMDQLTTVAGTPADRELYAKWQLERGYPDGTNTYSNYDEGTLTKLADSGDIQAMHALADLYIDENHLEKYGFKAATEIYNRAAIYGSTNALLHLAIMKSSGLVTIDESDPLHRQNALEILSLLNVAALRGDRMPNISFGDSIRKKDIVITEDDEKYIQARSQEIYNELQQKRIELGLSSFDNSVPDATKRFFDIIESSPHH